MSLSYAESWKPNTESVSTRPDCWCDWLMLQLHEQLKPTQGQTRKMFETLWQHQLATSICLDTVWCQQNLSQVQAACSPSSLEITNYMFLLDLQTPGNWRRETGVENGLMHLDLIDTPSKLHVKQPNELIWIWLIVLTMKLHCFCTINST
jgi:hypothetical protein